MDWHVLKTAAEYKKAIRRTMELFDALPDSPEDKELDLLLVLVKDYEDKHIVLPELDPIEVIKLKMEENNIKAKDLMPIIGSAGHVSSVLSGRRELTLKVAQNLRNYFDLPAEVFISQTGKVKVLTGKVKIKTRSKDSKETVILNSPKIVYKVKVKSTEKSKSPISQKPVRLKH
jgi:HTH-type transcriptional regulator / antitoxin HigA